MSSILVFSQREDNGSHWKVAAVGIRGVVVHLQTKHVHNTEITIDSRKKKQNLKKMDKARWKKILIYYNPNNKMNIYEI